MKIKEMAEEIKRQKDSGYLVWKIVGQLLEAIKGAEESYAEGDITGKPGAWLFFPDKTPSLLEAAKEVESWFRVGAQDKGQELLDDLKAAIERETTKA